MCELVDARQAMPDAPTPTPGQDFRCASTFTTLPAASR